MINDILETVWITLAMMGTIAALNTTYNISGPFQGLQHLTRWSLFLTLSAALYRELWWLALVSTVNGLVFLLHWSLVFARCRPPPRGEKAFHNILCYLFLPFLMITVAFNNGAYEARKSKSITGLVVFTIVYDAIASAHDIFNPKEPAYPNLPMSLPRISVIALFAGVAWLYFMSHI